MRLQCYLFVSYFSFNPAFIANVSSFVFKNFFMGLEILDFLINRFCFIFALSMSLINLF